jgi:carbon starvation protein CstA
MVLFGHHFTFIANRVHLGSAIAIIWGWVPASFELAVFFCEGVVELVL